MPQPPKLTMGHVAMHYSRPEDGPLAAKLLGILGFHQDEPLSFDGGVSNFYRLWTDKDTPRHDGIVFLSYLPKSLRDLQARIREALDVGGRDEDPVVAAFKATEADDPELCFHVGLMYASLDELEAHVAAIEADPKLNGRIKIVANRPPAGHDPEIDAIIDASPIFSKTERTTYGHFGVQVFIVTDLLSGGPLGEQMTVELDYVFPGHPQNVFTEVAA
ncbi:hypothetical protein MB02_16585 [Croceicoccus estronivorus]|uniref:hypothetical protein n=1 Tax=Croceicoccus estronivorus TaxID=1172626 RepID=UPI0008300FA5|nr:hypothetical protein [Croceicoccus estronivorus]OCC22475.1 hypothetical protein MB02_16585 [Croceicoccus estronivorus]